MNVSSEYYDEDQLELQYNFYRIAIPVMLLFGLISIIINAIIVASARWIRRALSPTICFNISLAGADAFASLVISAGLLTNSLLPIVYDIHVGVYYECVAHVLEILRMGGMTASVLHLLALAINHYIGILKPLHYASTMTRRNALIGISVMWILPILFFTVYFSSVHGMGFQSPMCNDYTFLMKSTYRNVIGAVFFTPLVLMAVIYAHIFLIVRQHHKGIVQYQNTSQLNKNVKAVITTLLIVGTYIIGWMPAVLFFLVTCLECSFPFTEVPNKIMFAMTFISNTLIILKSLVDPIIYAARMKEIRGALDRIRRSCFCGRSLRITGRGGPRGTRGIDTMSSIRSRTDTTSLRLQSTYGNRDRGSPLYLFQTKKLISENGC